MVRKVDGVGGPETSAPEMIFEDGSQDLSHESMTPPADWTGEVPAQAPQIEIVKERSVRRLMRMSFLKIAQLRNKELYVLSQAEEDEIAPELTDYINRHAPLAEAVRAVDEISGIGALLAALFIRVMLDLREENRIRKGQVQQSVQIDQGERDPDVEIGKTWGVPVL